MPITVNRGGSPNWSNPAQPGGAPLHPVGGGFMGGQQGQGQQGRLNPFPSGAQTLGQPMYPWLQSWGGPYTAGPTDMQNQILQNMFKMFGGGGNSGGSFSSGGYGADPPGLGVSSVVGSANPHTDLTYVNQTKDALQKIKDYQDVGALKRIASSSAAGGNALSGARIGAEHDYLGQSGAQFESTIGQLMQSALENERNRQNAVTIAGIGAAPGIMGVHEREREANMQNQLSGMGMLWGAAGLPQQAAQGELQGQYQDWLRQIGALRDESRYPDYLALQTLNQGRYGGQTPNQYGPSQAAGWASLLAALFGNGGAQGWSGSLGGSAVNGIGSLLQGLFGGGGGGGGYDNPYGDMSGYTGDSMYGDPIGPQMYDPYADPWANDNWDWMDTSWMGDYGG